MINYELDYHDFDSCGLGVDEMCENLKLPILGATYVPSISMLSWTNCADLVTFLSGYVMFIKLYNAIMQSCIMYMCTRKDGVIFRIKPVNKADTKM